MTEEGERKKRKQQEGKRTVDEKKKNKRKKKKREARQRSCRAVVRLQSERSLLGVVKVTYCL